MLGALAGPGLVSIVVVGSDTSRSLWRRLVPLALAGAIVAQGSWTRARLREQPTAAHYHNLALVQVDLGQPRAAVMTLSLALTINPAHPVIRIERASLFRALGQLEQAEADLDELAAQPDNPAWVQARAADERSRVDGLRGVRR